MPAASPVDLGEMFHRLNNQLSIILANAELLETKCPDEQSRARAAQVVASAIEAMTTTRDLRTRLAQGGASGPETDEPSPRRTVGCQPIDTTPLRVSSS